MTRGPRVCRNAPQDPPDKSPNAHTHSLSVAVDVLVVAPLTQPVFLTFPLHEGRGQVLGARYMPRHDPGYHRWSIFDAVGHGDVVGWSG